LAKHVTNFGIMYYLVVIIGTTIFYQLEIFASTLTSLLSLNKSACVSIHF
jgi:hypothetical protein